MYHIYPISFPQTQDHSAGDNVKVTINGTDKDGKPTHNEWTGKFDGKDYPVTGDPTSDARSYTKIDNRTLELKVKKSGQITISGFMVVSADGKTRTVNVRGTDPAGKTFGHSLRGLETLWPIARKPVGSR